ncbi:hypothetical protein [Bacillus sp. 491mf]|uniref:hypothetical protein n=1 Tax=Bacillus sp. 491mf TaxID=1761755 RepID=UPI001C42E949|nr:hypothetical protein [Bacillus sp. 491mf]
MAGKGPDRYYAQPDALAHLKRKGFICLFSTCIYMAENHLRKAIKNAWVISPMRFNLVDSLITSLLPQ